MKLLTPQANKELGSQEQIRTLMRTQELEKAAQKARINLADAEADFQATLARNRLQWATEEREHSQRIAEMTVEVKALEKRRETALKPVNQLEQEARARLQEAIDYEAKVKEREEHVEAWAEILQDQLDAVGAKEQDIIWKAQTIEAQKKGIAEQQEQTRTGIKHLNQLTADFHASVQKAEKELDERKTALFLWDRSLQAKEAKQKRVIVKLQNMVIKIADDRTTLKSAWDELERKRLSPKKKLK